MLVAEGTIPDDIAVYAYSGLPDDDSFSWKVHPRVSEIHLHPGWNETRLYRLDMALLALAVPMKYSAKRVCPPSQPTPSWTGGQVHGLGKSQKEGPPGVT